MSSLPSFRDEASSCWDTSVSVFARIRSLRTLSRQSRLRASRSAGANAAATRRSTRSNSSSQTNSIDSRVSSRSTTLSPSLDLTVVGTRDLPPSGNTMRDAMRVHMSPQCCMRIAASVWMPAASDGRCTSPTPRSACGRWSGCTPVRIWVFRATTRLMRLSMVVRVLATAGVVAAGNAGRVYVIRGISMALMACTACASENMRRLAYAQKRFAFCISSLSWRVQSRLCARCTPRYLYVSSRPMRGTSRMVLCVDDVGS